MEKKTTQQSYEKELSESLQTLEHQEEEWGTAHPELVNTLSRIGGLYWALGQYSRSVAFGERALDILVSELGSQDSQTVTAAENLIQALIKIRQFRPALNLRNRFFQALSSDHPRYAYFQALEAYITKESTRAGFRAPSAAAKKKKKKRRKK